MTQTLHYLPVKISHEDGFSPQSDNCILDYKNFFRHSVDSLFMPFDCLNNKSGIIFNLENNKKIIYEINDEINILNDEKNN